MKKHLAVVSLMIFCLQAQTQTVKMLTSGTKTSMRGLSVVDDKTVWVSGSNGMVGLSVDSGNTWKWMTVKGFEKTEFRDIEAFDEKTAIIMAIDSPAYLLKTVDAGENWKIIFEDHTKGMFLDAMEFWNEQSGIVIGDPIDGKFFIARTFNEGKGWRTVPEANRPVADSGEACFASSGTNVRKLNKTEAIFISGGRSSNLFIRDKKINIPVIQGTESTGANSIAVKNNKMMMIVGGDFNTKDATEKNCVYTTNGGLSWNYPEIPPHGYRSCVEWIGKSTWITCGLNGTDITNDNGKTFSWISKDGYHVCRKAKKGKAVFFAGGGGRIGKLSL
ncbi:MAG: oxidoreductase [Bacteroidetes bacterium]|nr:oxidoreductase [Bacteroidota bacterium]